MKLQHSFSYNHAHNASISSLLTHKTLHSMSKHLVGIWILIAWMTQNQTDSNVSTSCSIQLTSNIKYVFLDCVITRLHKNDDETEGDQLADPSAT